MGGEGEYSSILRASSSIADQLSVFSRRCYFVNSLPRRSNSPILSYPSRRTRVWILRRSVLSLSLYGSHPSTEITFLEQIDANSSESKVDAGSELAAKVSEIERCVSFLLAPLFPFVSRSLDSDSLPSSYLTSALSRRSWS